MRKRAILILIAIAAVAAAIVLLVLVRNATPPRPARLLPAADAYVFIDLAMLRKGAAFKDLPNVQFDPEYAEFVRQTGFQFERDLDQAAFAVHLPPSVPVRGQSPAETRYSEVFAASFDSGKLDAYLRKLAATVETYRATNVYVIPLPGRTLRVAILGQELVAASNTEGPYVIQGIIDRQHQLAAGVPEMIRAYYPKAPLGSVAWAIARVGSSGQQGNSTFTLPGGFNVFLPADTVVVASVRYLGSVVLRTQAFAPNEDGARRVSDQLSAFLALYRAMENAQSESANPDIKQFFDSIQVSQEDNRAELRATIPSGLFKKLVAESPNLPTPAAPASGPEKKEPEQTRRHTRRHRR